MMEKEMQEHAFKELLKKVVDNGQNYTEKMKSDLKKLLTTGNLLRRFVKRPLPILPCTAGNERR